DVFCEARFLLHGLDSSCWPQCQLGAMEIKQQLRLSQQLVMTPQLQQAIRLLQLSRLELIEEVGRELDNNPVLSDEDAGEARSRGDEPRGRAEGQPSKLDEPEAFARTTEANTTEKA